MNVNFEYYKIFYYVAKYNNFTKAARVLNNSQPNITRAMNCLEHKLNCTLFIRSNRGVRLTPEGEHLYTRVSAAMNQLQAAEAELFDPSRLNCGKISIGTTETALNIYLLDKLKQFHEDYPNVRLKIYNHSTPQAIQSVKNGEIDFAIVTTPTNVKPPLKKLHLQSFQEILIGGSSFFHLEHQELSLAQLQEYPLICLGRETMTYQFYHQLFLHHGLELTTDTETATSDQLLPLVKCGLGLAFIPEPMAQEAISQHSVIQIRLKENIPERQICMIYDPQHPINAATQMFQKLCDSTDG